MAQEYIEGTPLKMEEASQRLLDAAKVNVANSAPVSTYHPVGCEHCGGRGYKGRMGIYEMLENTVGMKVKIQSRAATSEIFQEATRSGMRTLRQDALEKVLSGHIDLKQARLV